jgi:hypothetical protein
MKVGTDAGAVVGFDAGPVADGAEAGDCGGGAVGAGALGAGCT